MRTKTLLLAAAALSASVLVSSAQVYSANVVGYINVTCAAGKYTAIANQLTNTDLTLPSLFQNVPDGTQLLTWNGVNDYNYYTFISPDVYDGNGDLANTVTLVPGQGALLKNNEATDFTVTFVGDVMQSATPTLTVPINSGLNLVSSIPPVGGKPLTDLLFPNVDGLQIFKWDPSLGSEGDWTYFTIIAGDIYDGDGNVVTDTFTIAVGEGFMASNNPGDTGQANISWSRSFEVN